MVVKTLLSTLTSDIAQYHIDVNEDVFSRDVRLQQVREWLSRLKSIVKKTDTLNVFYFHVFTLVLPFELTSEFSRFNREFKVYSTSALLSNPSQQELRALYHLGIAYKKWLVPSSDLLPQIPQ